MIINFDQELKTIDDKIIEDEGKPLTLRKVCTSSLLNPVPNETIDGTQKFKLWELAKKIKNATNETDFSVEELSLIKDRIGKIYLQTITGRCYELIENAPNKK